MITKAAPYAIGAYQRTLGNKAAAGTGASGFASALGQEVASGVEALRSSEQLTLQAMSGQADVQSLVEAVSMAELSLQKVTAVRDRVITAYQEIMRMPI